MCAGIFRKVAASRNGEMWNISFKKEYVRGRRSNSRIPFKIFIKVAKGMREIG